MIFHIENKTYVLKCRMTYIQIQGNSCCTVEKNLGQLDLIWPYFTHAKYVSAKGTNNASTVTKSLSIYPIKTSSVTRNKYHRDITNRNFLASALSSAFWIRLSSSLSLASSWDPYSATVSKLAECLSAN